jgi:hypothetical protein
MEIVKSNLGRKKLSDELRRTHEFTLNLNDAEYEVLCSLRNRFSSKSVAAYIRSSLQDAYNHHQHL